MIWYILYKIGLAKKEMKMKIIDEKKGIAKVYTEYNWKFNK